MSGLTRMTKSLGLVEEEPPRQIAKEGVPGLLARIPPDRREEAIELVEAAIAPVLGLRLTHEPRSVERAAIAADHILYGLVAAGRTA